MTLFTGLSAFPVTPADAGGRIDGPALAVLIERLAAAGVDSVGLLGSTGAYPYLNRAERRRAVEIAADCLAGRVPLVVGIGALRTDEVVALAGDAEAAGAVGLLLAPMAYLPLREAEVFQHFATVAGATDLPICIYDNPTTTRFDFTDELIARLAAVPGIVAIKRPAVVADGMGQRHAALAAAVPAGFSIGYSVDWHAADAILAGGQTWYSVIGGLLPRPALRLMRAAQAGDVAEVRRLDARFQPLWALFRELSSFRVVHAAAELLGLGPAVPPLPILPLDAADRRRVADALAPLATD